MKSETINLFEFGDPHLYDKTRFAALESNLVKVWKSRKEKNINEEIEILTENENEEEVKKEDYQPFLSFHHSGKIRARNWVGFIQDDEQLIEIYPKVFNSIIHPKENMLQHIFFWMDYCTKIRFPHTQAGLNTRDIDSFPELIIYLMANHIKEILEEKPLSLYQEVEESMQMPRGRLNFQRYINNSLVKGSWHQMECDHEPFVFDNKVNRVIKYCARLLEHQARLDSNKNLLRDITFILDEVEDVPCTIFDLQQIKLNAFFEEYHFALDYCRMILEQQLYNAEAYEMNRWTMLFPMELLFEDFIAGFVKTHFSNEWDVEFQKSEMYVSDEPKAFRMMHDIYLKGISGMNKDKCIIIDTKYKLRSVEDKKSNKKGVSQADIYQMVTYAVKRNCGEVILMYPCALGQASESNTFKINYANNAKQIKIHVIDVPFWCDEKLDKRQLASNLKKTIAQALA